MMLMTMSLHGTMISWLFLITIVSAYAPFPQNQCRIKKRNSCRLPTLSRVPTPTLCSYKRPCTRMYHMGHSHSHHDHGHGHDQTMTMLPKTFNRKRMIRRLAVILFCWIATCGTKFISRKQSLTQTDWLHFVVTSIALTSASKIKKTMHKSVDKFRSFVDGIKKHSSSVENLKDEINNDTTPRLSQQQQRTIQVDRIEADRVTWIGVAVNLLLSVGKLGVGITSHSSALVADAGHSLSDLVSDFITLWTVNIARIPPDDDHPYGHYKFEAIGSLFLSLTLLATGGSVGLMANKQLIKVLHATSAATVATATSSTVVAATAAAPVTVPGPLALVMAGLSIISKEWLFRITKTVGERLRSPVVIANAWHHRSDAYSSVLALLSIAWAMTGFPAADAAAGILVAGMICMTGSEILVESVKQLSDSADSDLQQEVVEILNELDDDDVITTISVRARQMGSAASVDVTVEIPSVLSTTATRAVENRVRQRLLNELDRRRGGGDAALSSGVIANVYAKPYLHFMEDPSLASTTSTIINDEFAFAKLAFEKFDTDFDGRLSTEELKSGIEKAFKIKLSPDRVQKLMDEFDKDKTGYIELEEMVTIDKLRKKIEMLSKEEKEVAIRQEQEQQQQQQQNSLDDMPSTTYIEQQVRAEAKVLYPKISSIEGVTVHYTSQSSVTVDVNIRIIPDGKQNNATNENDALRRIHLYAQELKNHLETNLHEIENARIYLDLNSKNSSSYDDDDDKKKNLTFSSSLAP